MNARNGQGQEDKDRGTVQINHNYQPLYLQVLCIASFSTVWSGFLLPPRAGQNVSLPNPSHILMLLVLALFLSTMLESSYPYKPLLINNSWFLWINFFYRFICVVCSFGRKWNAEKRNDRMEAKTKKLIHKWGYLLCLYTYGFFKDDPYVQVIKSFTFHVSLYYLGITEWSSSGNRMKKVRIVM